METTQLSFDTPEIKKKLGAIRADFQKIRTSGKYVGMELAYAIRDRQQHYKNAAADKVKQAEAAVERTGQAMINADEKLPAKELQELTFQHEESIAAHKDALALQEGIKQQFHDMLETAKRAALKRDEENANKVKNYGSENSRNKGSKAAW